MKIKKKEKSIFRTTLMGMLFVAGIEILLLVMAIYTSNVGNQLNQNAVDILKKQVENRSSYLENILCSDQDLAVLSGQINNTVQEMSQDGTIDLQKIDKDKASYLPVMKKISDMLIGTMRQKSVTGIFVAFNTENLDEKPENSYIPGIYFRDLDPDSAVPDNNTDLLLERAPNELIKSMSISTDKGWMPKFQLNTDAVKDIIYPAYQEAWKDQAGLNAKEYGHWTREPYILEGDSRSAIAYTVPLILKDGTVYGVLGVEILEEHLQTLMPYTELQNDEAGTYVLGFTKYSLKESKIKVHAVGCFGKNGLADSDDNKYIVLNEEEYGNYQARVAAQDYYFVAYPLQLYNKNAPFSDEQWLLIGTVARNQLFSFTSHVLRLLFMTVMLTLAVGIVSSFVVSRRLARPVIQLSEQVAEAQDKHKVIPSLSPTGFKELDRFSSAITQMGRDIVTTSTKFLRIMEMASVELGGYEIRPDDGTVYVTDNFFSMLGMEEKNKEELTVDTFQEILNELDRTCSYTMTSGGARVYCIRHSDAKLSYIRMEVNIEGNIRVGLVEDVTVATMERLNIEHERDYDTLTGLYNRVAFRRESEKVFEESEKLGCAAFVMIDMDNLKYTNDTFGHDWGDRYIHEAGKCFAEYTPNSTLCARISGDEFNLLFYGYDSKDQIREVLRSLKARIDEISIMLPNGRKLKISISGGIAWYPDDSVSLDELKKYADFAMYQVKRSTKGRLQEFDPDVYNRNAYETMCRKEFHQFINRELVVYHYQPIVSARTGRAVAYEALMRVQMPALKSPEDVVRMAKEENCLHELERITFFKAAEGYNHLRVQGLIRGDELLFINSIASQNLTEEEYTEFDRRFHYLQPQLVVEITEEESLDMKCLEKKRGMTGFRGVFALDDYGSGYNTEKNLLDMSPMYIKVDSSMIRNIDSDIDKQQIVTNIIEYAHQRGMFIVAEGLETEKEVRKVIELGADLLQGYYLAKPAAKPENISREAVSLIEECKKA